MTPLERQQDAERALWELLEKKSTDRIALPEALRSVLSTAEAAIHPPMHTVNHQGFAEKHLEAYRAMAWQMMDDAAAQRDPRETYKTIRKAAEGSGLQLSPAPWEKASEKAPELA
jgi:hypothetical protein